MKQLLSILAILSGCLALNANNIQVSDVRLENPDEDLKTVFVNVDVSWENSWNITGAPGNHDAAWVFIKYRESKGAWKHATIGGTLSPVGSRAALVADNRGVFIRRGDSFTGTGNITHNDVRITWRYGLDGVEDAALVTIQVFAIEMVHVTGGAFDLAFAKGQKFYPMLRRNPAGGSPIYRVNSENPITVGAADGNLYFEAGSGTTSGGADGIIPAAYPKGFDAFYCMKYEVSQQQWVDFFNTLSAAQQTALDITDPGGKGSDAEVNRNAVSWTGGLTASTSLPFLPVNYVSTARAFAYLDWAGLRPMSELEFEKAARGPTATFGDEYVWGQPDLSSTTYTLVDQNLSTERLANPSADLGNCVWSSTQPVDAAAKGPMRIGGVAASPAAFNRESTGAGYYGAMDLAGNLSELVVNVGSIGGRAFIDNHGDGTLNANGTFSVAGWPSAIGSLGERGGSFSQVTFWLLISEREFCLSTTNAADILARRGFRGVRTAP